MQFYRLKKGSKCHKEILQAPSTSKGIGRFRFLCWDWKPESGRLGIVARGPLDFYEQIEADPRFSEEMRSGGMGFPNVASGRTSEIKHFLISSMFPQYR